MADDLFSQLHFDPTQAHIWLAGRRMMLLHAQAFGLLRREIVDLVGVDKARAAFTRQGYNSGALDAESAARFRPSASLHEMFAVGPELHTLLGMVRAEALDVSFDTANGTFHAEYLWKSSSECSAHLDAFGLGSQPGGWSQIGYASGYASVFLGRPILFREIECVAMGHECCRVVGRPAEEWADGDADIRYMRGEQLNRVTSSFSHEATAPQADGRRIVGASAGFNIAFDMLQHVANTDAVVLFLGESGVGKEVFARQLHALGSRASRPFIALNCAAIPESLVEAELFGVEKGAFTGATASRPGRFERAEGGTLFLDEIATLSLAAQGKLLRAIQEGEYERVGGTTVRRANIRIVAATNVDLREAMEAGQFRADLFYRLNVFPIRIPPLRERRADLPLLMEHFLAVYSARYGKRITGFEEDAVAAMLGYAWPGNIRELENVVERGVIMGRDDEPLRLYHLFSGGERLEAASYRLRPDGRVSAPEKEEMPALTMPEAALQSGLTLAEMEERLVQQALRQTNGNKTKAAALLGLSRTQLHYRLRQRS